MAFSGVEWVPVERAPDLYKGHCSLQFLMNQPHSFDNCIKDKPITLSKLKIS